MDRNNLSLTEAKKRIKAQMALDEKAERSHFVIENSGSEKDMEEQALKIINLIMDSMKLLCLLLRRHRHNHVDVVICLSQ